MKLSSLSSALDRHGKARRFLWFLLIVAAVAVAYRAVPSFDFVNYDDDLYISENRALDGGLTLKNIRWALEANLIYGSREAEYWQPVTSITRLVDRSLFGRNPAGHHLQSLLWHALNGCLVFLLTLRLGGREVFSGVVALLFVLHPVNVEVVCWLAARKDLLCATGSLLTLLAYLRFTANPSVGRYALALVAYAAALMAKPSAIALPMALVLLDFFRAGQESAGGAPFPAGGPRNWLRLMVEKIPFFLLAGLTAGLTVLSQQEMGGIHAPVMPTVMRMAVAAIGYLDYLRMFLWPRGFCVLYPVDSLAPDTVIAISAGLVLIALTLLAFAFRHRVPAVLWGWLWFLLLLAPLMGIVPFGRQSVADRYMYLPMLGLTVALVAAVATWRNRRVSPVRDWLVVIPTIGLLTAVASLTQAQTLTWKDSEALWQQAIRMDPGNGLARTNYAVFLARAGNEREAEFQLRLARKDAPNLAGIGQQLAVLLVSQRRYQEALPLVESLIQTSPTTMKLHSLLATTLDQLGRPDDARRARSRQQAIRGRIFLLQGTSYLESGDWAAAREQLALAWSAQDAIEMLLHQRVSLAPAVDWAARAEQAIAKTPGAPLANFAFLRGLIHGLQSRWPEAELAFAESARVNSDDEETAWRHAVCLFRVGRTDEATKKFAQIVAKRPPGADMSGAWAAAQLSLESPPPSPAAR